MSETAIPASVGDTANEYTDWEIPPQSVEVLKEQGCITFDDQGQLILKQDCVEKARAIVDQMESSGVTPVMARPQMQQNTYSNHQNMQHHYQMVEGQQNVQQNPSETSRSSDELSIAEFMAGLPSPGTSQPQTPQQFQYRQPAPARSVQQIPRTHLVRAELREPHPAPRAYPVATRVSLEAASTSPRGKGGKQKKPPNKPAKPRLTKKQQAEAALALSREEQAVMSSQNGTEITGSNTVFTQNNQMYILASQPVHGGSMVVGPRMEASHRQPVAVVRPSVVTGQVVSGQLRGQVARPVNLQAMRPHAGSRQSIQMVSLGNITSSQAQGQMVQVRGQMVPGQMNALTPNQGQVAVSSHGYIQVSNGNISPNGRLVYVNTPHTPVVRQAVMNGQGQSAPSNQGQLVGTQKSATAQGLNMRQQNPNNHQFQNVYPQTVGTPQGQNMGQPNPNTPGQSMRPLNSNSPHLQNMQQRNPTLPQGQITQGQVYYQNGQVVKDPKQGGETRLSNNYLMGHLPHISNLMQQRQESSQGKKKKGHPIPIPLNGIAQISPQQGVSQGQSVLATTADSNVTQSAGKDSNSAITQAGSATGPRPYIPSLCTPQATPVRPAGMLQNSGFADQSGQASFQQHFSASVANDGSPKKGVVKKKKKQSLEPRMYGPELPPFVPRKNEAHTVVEPASTATPARAHPLSIEVRQEPPPRPKETHTPKFIPGKVAICGNCGGGSRDVAWCHTCARAFPEDVKLVDDVGKKVQVGKNSEGAKMKEQKTVGQIVVRKIIATIPMEIAQAASQPLTKEKVKRPTRKNKKVHEEPECLTLSSDDDCDKEDAPKEQEGVKEQDVQTEEDIEIEELDVTKLLEGDEVMDFCMTTMEVAKFGIYNSKVDEKSRRIFIVQSGLHIPVQDVDGEVTSVWIPKERINLIEYNLDGRMRLIAIHVDQSMARWIQARLKLKKEDNMFDLKSQEHLCFSVRVREAKKISWAETVGLIQNVLLDSARKRILIIFDSQKSKTEDFKQRLVTHYERIQEKSDNEINLILASYAKYVKPEPPVIVNHCQDTLKIIEKRQAFEPGRTLFTFPPAPSKGGISITGEDYVCLEDEQFLNDSMIDFYLKFVHLTKLPAVDRDKIHIFSTYFYKRLTQRPPSKRRPAFEDDPKLTPEEKRHCRVKSWTKNVDIFDKEYLLVPICEKSHWFLAIICFPYLQGPVLAKDNTPVVLPPTPKRKGGRRKVADLDKLPPGVKTFMIGSTTITPVGGTTLEDVKPATLLLQDDSDRDEAESDSEVEEGQTPEDSQLLPSSQDSSSQPEPTAGPDPEVTLPGLCDPEKVSTTPLQPSQNTSLPFMNNVDNEAVKQPCILVFDSLEGPSRGKIVATLREYLRIEYKVKKGEDRPFKDFVKGVILRVPQQTNYSDCGLYVLQYAESFFEDNPIKDFRTPIASMRKWFDSMVVTRKREELGDLIVDLTEKQNPGLSSSLPIIRFPTVKGVLVQSEDEGEHMSSEASAFSGQDPSTPEKPQTQMLPKFHVITPAWRDGQEQSSQEPNWAEDEEYDEGEWDENGQWEEQEWEGEEQKEWEEQDEGGENGEWAGSEQEKGEWTENGEENGELAETSQSWETTWAGPVVDEIAGEVEVNDNQITEETKSTISIPRETTSETPRDSPGEVAKSTDHGFVVTREDVETDVNDKKEVKTSQQLFVVSEPVGQVSLRTKDALKRTKGDPSPQVNSSKKQKLVEYNDSSDGSA